MSGSKRIVKTALRWWLALLCAVALVATACGSDDDGNGGGTAADATTEPSGDGAGSSDGADASGGAQGPQYGGTLVFALEAETTNGLNPVTAQAAVSGHIIFRQIYETLVIEGTDGQFRPLLLESFDSNADFTEWTFTLRPGITFHDGTPADGAALKRHLEELEKGTLTGIAMSDLDIESLAVVDDLSVLISLGSPHAGLPALFTNHLGYLGSPSMYDLGTEAAQNPIGTGPFMLDEWVENEVTRLVRNPDYWRTDAEGRRLPYLDAIEFRPNPDNDGRFASMQAGDIDANVVNTGLRVGDYNSQFKTFWEGDAYSEPTHLLFNASRPPFDDVEFRRALAQCTDRQLVSDLRWDGRVPADGPFHVGTPGYLEDPGFPEFDPDAGSAAIARLGIDSVALGTTNDPANLLTNELLARMWGDCGLDVTLTQVDQAELITNAAIGNFTAFLWRNHNGYALAAERIWWHSDFSQGLALNFGRIRDDRIDAALDESKLTDDPDRLRELAEEVNRAFADGVYNMWLYHSNWVIATQDYVHGIDALTIPEGGEHVKVLSGRVFLGETWLDQ